MPCLLLLTPILRAARFQEAHISAEAADFRAEAPAEAAEAVGKCV